MLTYKTLDSRTAQQLVAAGEKKAQEINSPSNLAVCDHAGYLITHLRMDGAQLPSINHSIQKAWTSAQFGKATDDLTADSEPGGELYGLNTTLDNQVIVFAGGIPLTLDGKVVGAVGASGGTADQDKAVAQAMAEAFKG